MNLYSSKEKPIKGLRIRALKSKWCDWSQPTKGMGPWEGVSLLEKEGYMLEAESHYPLPPHQLPLPATKDGAWVPFLPPILFPTHRNDLCPRDVGCDVAHEEGASLMEGPRFTFQPRSVLRLLPFFFFGLLLFLECLFFAESGGSR